MVTQRKTPQQVAELHALHPDVIEASEAVYDLLHTDPAYKNLETRREEVHIHGICTFASKLLVKQFRAQGYAAKVFNATYSLGWESMEHYYTVMRSSKGVMAFDPTWVQFLDNANMPLEQMLRLPKVLVGTPEEAAEAAKIAGVPEGLLVLWDRRLAAPDTKFSSPYPSTVLS